MQPGQRPYSAIAAYTLSQRIGLPGMADDIGHWAGPPGTCALAAGSAVLILATATAAGAILPRRLRG